ARAVSAAAAGIGDVLPTATWRASPIRRTITAASSSSSRSSRSGGALCMHVPLQITGKAFRTRRQARVLGKMLRIRRIVTGKRQRPGAARSHRDGVHVKPGQRAGGEQRIVEERAVVKLL